MPYKLDNKKQIYERIPIPPFFLPFPLIARLPCSVLLWWPQSARILTLCDDHVCVSMWAIVPMSPGSGRVRSESPDHKTLPPPPHHNSPAPRSRAINYRLWSEDELRAETVTPDDPGQILSHNRWVVTTYWPGGPHTWTIGHGGSLSLRAEAGLRGELWWHVSRQPWW